MVPTSQISQSWNVTIPLHLHCLHLLARETENTPSLSSQGLVFKNQLLQSIQSKDASQSDSEIFDLPLLSRVFIHDCEPSKSAKILCFMSPNTIIAQCKFVTEFPTRHSAATNCYFCPWLTLVEVSLIPLFFSLQLFKSFEIYPLQVMKNVSLENSLQSFFFF